MIIKDYIKAKGVNGIIREILEFGQDHSALNLLETKYITKEVLEDPLNINLDFGGRHTFSRYTEVNQRIGNTISKLRKENPDNWPKRVGAENNKSVNWKLISPEGQEFIICGRLNQFCKERGISANTIKKAVKEGWIPKRGVCAGWQAFNLDAKIGTTRETLNHGISHSGLNNPWHKQQKKEEANG